MSVGKTRVEKKDPENTVIKAPKDQSSAKVVKNQNETNAMK